MVLPAALIGLAGLHLFLFRCAGPAGPFEVRGRAEGEDRLFFPRQIWKTSLGWRWSLPASVRWPSGSGGLVGRGDAYPGDYHPEPEWYSCSYSSTCV